MGLWQSALIILRKDFRQRMRDRTGLVVAFGVPLAIAALMGAALGGANEGLDYPLAIVEGADPARAEAFAGWLAGQAWLGDGLRLATLDEAEARARLDDGRLAAAVVFAPGAPRVLARQEGVFAARATQGLVDRFLAEGRATALPTRTRPVSPGGALRMIDYFAATMSVLFLNFGVLSGVRVLEQERHSGALARLAAAPIRPLAVLLGKFSGLFLQGLVQMLVLIAATSLLFGTRWGAPVPVALLVFATVFMAIGLTSLFMAWGGNAERGALFASLGIFLLAVLGGQFMPPQGLPEVFDTLQRLTPNGQASRAFVDLAASAPGASYGFLWEPLLVTLAVGVTGLVYGVRRAHGALHRASA